jgi:hypothetical protein
MAVTDTEYPAELRVVRSDSHLQQTEVAVTVMGETVGLIRHPHTAARECRLHLL